MAPTLTVLAPVHLDLMHLLILGGNRHTQARALHLSPRTADLRIAQIKDALGTSDRFVLGVRAVRTGWVDPAFPVLHARDRRLCSRWATPTARRLDIIRHRGRGATVGQVASALRISPNTVRRELAWLAAANGAASAVHLGALCQALGWVGLPRPVNR